MDKSGNFYVTDSKNLLLVKPVQNPLPPPNWNYVSYDTLAVLSKKSPWGGFVSLTIDCNETFFIGNLETKEIWTYDLHTGDLKLLGTYQANFFDFEFYEGRLYAHCYERINSGGRAFLMDIHLDDLTVMDTVMEIINNAPVFGKVYGITSINQPCGPNLFYAPMDDHLLQYFVEDTTYLITPFPLLCTGGATSPTSWMGSYTPLGIDAVEVNSINADCSPPYTLTAHTRKGYYMRPDIQFSLDGMNYQSDSVFIVMDTGIYVIHVQDSFGCHKLSDSIVVNKFEFKSNVKTFPAQCGLPSGSAWISSVGETEITFDGVHYFPDSLRIDHLDAGTYTYYLRNASGCMDTLYFTITADPPPAISSIITSDADCNKSDGSITITVFGQGIHYQIDTVQNTSGVFSNLAPGSYTVYITDSNLCTIDTTVSIQGKNAPVISDILIEDAHCNIDNATVQIFSADTGLSVSIDGQQYETVTSLTDLAPGSYTLYIRNQMGCVTSLPVVIAQTGVPTFTVINITDEYCEAGNGAIHFMASGLDPLTYSLNGQILSSSSIDSLQSGMYSLKIQDKYGCVTEKDVTIESIDLQGYSAFDVNPGSCELRQATLTFAGQGEELYYEVAAEMYAPGDSVILSSGDYTLSIHQGPCSRDTTIHLFLPDCGYFIPNVFSPNHDGINDVFRVEGDVQVTEMRIFDRWGACLFSSNLSDAAWNGVYHGKNVPTGVYIYWVNIRHPDGRIELRKGDVTVVR